MSELSKYSGDIPKSRFEDNIYFIIITKIVLPVILTVLSGIFAYISGKKSNKAEKEAKYVNTYYQEVKEQIGNSETQIIFRGDSIPIGSIVASTLPEKDFYLSSGDPEYYTLGKSRWCLANGTHIVKGTKYGNAVKKEKIDDLQGYFLRGYDPDSKIDPEGNQRKLGGNQPHGFEDHIHHISTIAKTRSWPKEPLPSEQIGINYQYASADYKYNPMNTYLASSGNRGKETRPSNIAVNYFIKVN